jgi:hypothetical protein
MLFPKKDSLISIFSKIDSQKIYRIDQGIKFCSKIQSAQNRFKPGRERRPRRCEPNATRFVSNGRREREI